MAGPATIGALRVSLGLDTAQFDAGIRKTQATIHRLDFGKGIKAGLDELEGGFRSTASRAGVVGAALSGMGLAGVAAGAALVGLGAALGATRNALAFGDDIADTANKLAVTTDALQEYRFAVHALGGDYKDADEALEGFTKKFGAAHAQLTKKAARPFEALGLDAKSFDSTEEALQAVIREISELDKTAEQAAVADKLGLSAMLPAIRAGADAIEDMRQKAHDLGYVMSADLAEEAGAANDKFEDLQAILDVQMKSTLVELAPLLLSIAGGLADAAKAANLFANALKSIDDRSTDALKRQLQALQSRAESPVSLLYGGRGADLKRAAAIQAELAKRAQVPKPNPIAGTSLVPASGGGGGGTDKSAQRARASAEAIASAERDELSARKALTRDLVKLAVLREQQVDDELRQENERLKSQAAEGDITEAAAAKAAALNGQAAEAKRSLIRRELEADFENRHLVHMRQINGYYDDIARIEADLAATAAERGAVERRSLEHQQALERRRLASDLDQQIAREEITDSYKVTALAAQADLQAAEQRQLQRETQARIEAELSARNEAELQLQIEILDSQSALARTTGARRAIELDILKLEQQLERQKLEEVIASSQSSQVEKDIARAKLEVLGQIQSNQLEAAYRVEDAFDDAASAIGDMADAFEDQDWNKLVNSLAAAVDALQLAFGPNGSIGSKIGAVAGVAGAVGGIVGGTAGAGLSGAASGAMAGFTLGGPVGAAIGGVLGGIAGLFGGNSAKKKAKREAEERARQAELERQARVAAEHRALEIELMEAQGKAEEALNARRADSLTAMDASNRALQEQVWALQDAAEAAAKAAEQAKASRSLEIQLMDLQGNRSAALAARRQQELAAMDEGLRGLQQAIYGAEDLAAAREAAAADLENARADVARAHEQQTAALRATIEKMRGVAASMRSFRESLDDQAGMEAKSYDAAKAQFREVAALARLGNEDAQGRLQEVFSRFLTISKESAATELDFLRDLGEVKAATRAAEETASRQASIAEQQLAATDAMVAGILGLNGTLSPLPAAIANFNAALANFSSVTKQKLGANPEANAALAAATGYQGDFGTGGWQAWIVQQDPETRRRAREILTSFGQTFRISGFATGGSGVVGGYGGPDSQAVTMALTPGELVNVTRPGDAADIAEELKRLREFASAALTATAHDSREALVILRGWNNRGLPEERAA